MNGFFSLSVNTAEYEAAIQRLQRGVRDGFIDAQYGTLPVQGRLLAERCQDFTPPQNVGQGKAAVARDITRIFRPLDQKTFTDPGIKKIIRTDNRPAWERVARNMKGTHNLGNTQAMSFSTDWHKRNRQSRGRGVRAKYGNLGYVTLGGEAREVRRYIALKKKLVGWARGGWNATIVGLGGVVKGAWMARQGTDGGSLVKQLAGADPYIQSINSTSWAKYGQGEGNRIIRNAVSARARDMESYFERMMRLAADKAKKTA